MIDWALMLPFAALTVVGTYAGAWVAGRVDPRRLQLAFAVMLSVVGLAVGVAHVPELL